VAAVAHICCVYAQSKPGKAGTATEAEKVTKGKSVEYLTATLVYFLSSLWHTIRQCWPSGMVAGARALNDYQNSTLIMLGGLGTFTGFHLDWTEACNIAFSVGAPTAAAVAVWVFIHPLMLGVADAWLREQKHSIGQGTKRREIASYPNGFASDIRVHLEGEQLQAFRDHLEAHKESHKAAIGVENATVVLHQHAGDMVHVPVGWVHQVTNLSPCVKVAWDLYIPHHTHMYIELIHRIASKVFGTQMALDYMGANSVLGRIAGE
jgi:hypothetical protein